jgi:hypothetical protein
MAKTKTVTGKVEAATLKSQSHADGWNAALDAALNNTGWKPGTYKNVKVAFSATVEVVNPGSIVEYVVKLTVG